MGLETDGLEGLSKLFKETNKVTVKVYQVSEGAIEFAVNRVDSETGVQSVGAGAARAGICLQALGDMVDHDTAFPDVMC